MLAALCRNDYRGIRLELGTQSCTIYSHQDESGVGAEEMHAVLTCILDVKSLGFSDRCWERGIFEESLMTCKFWLDQMSRGKNLPRWGKIKFRDWTMESSIFDMLVGDSSMTSM